MNVQIILFSIITQLQYIWLFPRFCVNTSSLHTWV